MAGFRGIVLLSAFLLVATGATAANGVLQGSTALPIETEGSRTFTAGNGAALWEGDAGALELRVLGNDGAQVTRVVYRAFGYVSPTDPSAEVRWVERQERHELDLAQGELLLEARGPQFRALLHDAQFQSASSEARLPIGLTTAGIDVDHWLPATFSVGIFGNGDQGFEYRIPANSYQAQLRHGTVESHGENHFFAVDATFLLNNPDGAQVIQAYPRTETRPGSIYNPLDGTWFGAGTHDEYIHEYITVDGDAQLVASFDGLPTRTFSDALTVDIDGTSTLPEMQGTITIAGEETHEVDGETVDITGLHQLRLEGADQRTLRTGVDGDGDYTIVRYGAVAAEYDWATAAAAATAGTLLIGLIAWLGSQSKALLGGGAAVVGYARVAGNKVLEHPGRAEVYERIKANPGISMAELARAVEFGESTLNYHLRVLAKNEFVSQVRDGRYLRFFDRTTGQYANERKHALSALQNGTSSRIAAAILETPGVAQRELAARFGVAPSTVNWHIRRLSQVGLVDSRRDHPHTRYYPGDAWAGLPQDQLALA